MVPNPEPDSLRGIQEGNSQLEIQKNVGALVPRCGERVSSQRSSTGTGLESEGCHVV